MKLCHNSGMPVRNRKKHPYIMRFVIWSLVFVFVALAAGAVFIIKSKESVLEAARTESLAVPSDTEDPFPISVNPHTQTITENPEVGHYYNEHFSQNRKRRPEDGLLAYVGSQLAQFGWFQNLASPISRVLVVEPGERKEQVVKDFGEILHWDRQERETFAALVISSYPALSEGKFFPGHYVVESDATPEAVADLITNQFETQVASRYTDTVASLVPLEDALTIASLLEREAYDFEDMRYISGVIWNRLFSGMNLQIDASLQYAKASGGASAWWPPVRPQDKYIKSPFNTYAHEGLPPAPIASPSTEAILAALNPKETDCLFYFHDAKGDFHCTKTYEEHVALLKQYYGRGK
jgi:UPF0755 protein